MNTGKMNVVLLGGAKPLEAKGGKGLAPALGAYTLHGSAKGIGVPPGTAGPPVLVGPEGESRGKRSCIRSVIVEGHLEGRCENSERRPDGGVRQRFRLPGHSDPRRHDTQFVRDSASRRHARIARIRQPNRCVRISRALDSRPVKANSSL